jgi:hypothetical protein
MDPLSVAASVAGLLALAGKITSVLSTASSARTASITATHILNETQSLKYIFTQLKNLMSHPTLARHDRLGMVSVDELVAMLTGCVMVFSELDEELKGLGENDEMGYWDRFKWEQKESTLKKIIERLAVHKASLNFMLTLLVWWVSESFQYD